MDKLLNALNNAVLEQKLDLLPQLLQHGEGIEYLIDCLSDRELVIRAKAYQLLENVTSPEAQQAIAPGLLLNPGNRIFSVYRSGLWFTDEYYLLFDERYLQNYLNDLNHQIYKKQDEEDEQEQRMKCQRIHILKRKLLFI